MSETTSYDAVTWGEETGQVTLKVTGMGFRHSSEILNVFDLAIDGAKLTCEPDKPVTKSRSFSGGGSGDPFHITKISGGPIVPVNVDWKLSRKELGWFTGGQTTATGRYPKGNAYWLN